MSKEINKSINKVAQYKSNIESQTTKSGQILSGERIFTRSCGVNNSNVRAFIFTGMSNTKQSEDILEKLITDCGMYFIWDHCQMSIRKVERQDGMVDFRVEINRVDMPRLRRISQLLKMAGAVEGVYEDIPQRSNILA